MPNNPKPTTPAVIEAPVELLKPTDVVKVDAIATEDVSAIDTLNKTLLKHGTKPVKVIDEKDPAPEATAYFAYRRGDGERDAKKLDRLRNAHLHNFYKHIAKEHTHLLFEIDVEKVYFAYDEKTGIYEDWSHIRVKEMITRALINGGFKREAKVSLVNQIIVDMRSMFPERACHFDDFDSQDNWFHCSNGWVCLDLEEDGKDGKGLIKYKKRKFEDHTPKRLSRRVSAVPYDINATCPHYDKMMTDFQLKTDQVRVIDQFSGLLLTHEIKHQKMLAFIGKPGCGKSTIAEIWGKVLGEMGISIPLSDLAGDRFRFIGESLVGRTFVHFDEVDIKRSEMGSNLGNLITGNNFIVERKGENKKVNVKNKLKCVLTANSLPMSAEVGIFRRLILINFNHSFVDAETVDLSLPEKLEDEHSGILNRMLGGLADMRMMKTFTLIEGHEDVIEDYKISSNTIAEYLDEYFDPGTWENEVSSKVMFNTYVHWLGKNRGRMVLTPQRFGQMLGSQPLVKFKLDSKRGTHGIRVRTGLKIKPCYLEDSHEEVLIPTTNGTVPVIKSW